MYQDAQGALYIHEETASPAEPEKKAPVWPWVLAGAAVVAGAALWMSQSPTRRENPVDPAIDPLLLEAANPETPWQRLEVLAKHKAPEVRRALLQNPALCPVDDQGDVDTHLLFDLAMEFPDEAAEAPAFVLHAFYGDPLSVIDVIKRIASYTKNPDLILFIASNYGHIEPYVNTYISRNQYTPPEILTELSESYPRSVAQNRNTPPETLQKLSKNWPSYVASNPNASTSLLRELCEHPQESVRMYARENLSERGLL